MRVKIVYEDDAVMVIHKPAGFPVQTKKIGCMDCVSELKNYLNKCSKQNRQQINHQSSKNRNVGNHAAPYLGIVHRLDQPVEGLMVFAKTAKAAAGLSRQISSEDDSSMLKCYEAEVYGKMPAEQGELTDYLIHNPADNISRVAEESERKNDRAKESRLAYRVISGGEATQKLYIHLYTGRHHQIRVQLSHAGAPILGDQKYGTESSIRYSEENGYRMIALKAVHLEFVHPVSGQKMNWDLKASE